MSLVTKSQLVDLRFALLSELVNAHTVALTAEMLLRRANRRRLLDFEATLTQAEAVLAELHALGFALVVPNRLDDAPYYQATPAGVLAHERGQ